MTQISTGSFYLKYIASLDAMRQKIDMLSSRLMTGKKAQDLAGYGADAFPIMEETFSIRRYDFLSDSLGIVNNDLKMYETVLGALHNTTVQLSSAIHDVDMDGPSWEHDNKTLADNFLLSAQLVLNTEVHGSYIFGGKNYTMPPVKDLRSLELFKAGDTVLGSPVRHTDQPPYELPQIQYNDATPQFQSYMTAWKNVGDTNENAGYKSRSMPGGGTEDYAITATDEAVQFFVDAALLLKSSAQDNLTREERQNMLDQGRDLAKKAEERISLLRVRNDSYMNIAASIKDLYGSIQNTQTDILVDKTKSNDMEDMNNLAELVNQMKASYSLVGRYEKMSLINFL